MAHKLLYLLLPFVAMAGTDMFDGILDMRVCELREQCRLFEVPCHGRRSQLELHLQDAFGVCDVDAEAARLHRAGRRDADRRANRRAADAARRLAAGDAGRLLHSQQEAARYAGRSSAQILADAAQRARYLTKYLTKGEKGEV